MNISHSFSDHKAFKHQGKVFIYLGFLICVAACVHRQVLENRAVNVQEAQGILYCILCFMNSLII